MFLFFDVITLVRSYYKLGGLLFHRNGIKAVGAELVAEGVSVALAVDRHLEPYAVVFVDTALAVDDTLGSRPCLQLPEIPLRCVPLDENRQVEDVCHVCLVDSVDAAEILFHLLLIKGFNNYL